MKTLQTAIASFFAALVLSGASLTAGAYTMTGAGSSLSARLSEKQGNAMHQLAAELPVNAVNVHINGETPLFTYAPLMIGDSVLVPVRTVMQHLGCTVEWNDAAQSVTIRNDTVTAVFVIDTPTVTVNGTVRAIPAAAILIGDTTYVPLRAVSEALGAVVGWDESTNTAGIYTRVATAAKHTLTIGDYRVNIGDSTGTLFSLCGQPTYAISGENGLIWQVYATYPTAVMAVATDGGIVCGYYTCSPHFSVSDGISYGDPTPAGGLQYELTHSASASIHRYYDTIDGILCSICVLADGYNNLHDISASLANQSRFGLDILNSFRYEKHLALLEWDDAAAVCSADHARYMASTGTLTHSGADGSTGIRRYLSYNPGFKWTSWGENICAGAKNIFMCMNGWRNSRQHRTILLSDKKYAGIALIHSPGSAYEYCGAMLVLNGTPAE